MQMVFRMSRAPTASSYALFLPEACVAVLGLALHLLAPSSIAAAQPPAQRITHGASPVSPSHLPEDVEHIQQRAFLMSRRVQGQLDEARRGGDVRMTVCLDDMLAQINAAAREVERRSAALGAAVRGGDLAARDHAIAVLRVLERRLSDLSDDAARCTGRSPERSGHTTVTVIVDRDTPRLDPTRIRGRPTGWAHRPSLGR